MKGVKCHVRSFSNEFMTILPVSGMDLIEDLSRDFCESRRSLLRERQQKQQEFLSGKLPDFAPETVALRNASWKAEEIPNEMLCRRVEITGPASSIKMMINALNSGADVYMTDAEDSESPTWQNILSGQLNLYDAVRRNIYFTDPKTGKKYELNNKTAILMFRPRGLHLEERHFEVDGERVPAMIFDVALYLHNNAFELIKQGHSPALYIPKLESAKEAAWVDALLSRIEELEHLPRNSVKVTVLIETLPAVFQMHEIIWELRGRILGLNCGRWDYIFSFIKKLGALPNFIFPDRSELTMDKPFLTAYRDLLIQTCHGRGVFAMGGMAPQIPQKDPIKNAEAEAKIHEDKEREALAGHDGTWSAHPYTVPLAMKIFNLHLNGRPNQLNVLRDDVHVSAADLLKIPEGNNSLEGLRKNVRVNIKYMAPWLRGTGCVPIDGLMEDAATAEISRVQVWQLLKHGTVLDKLLLYTIIEEELEKIKIEVGDQEFEVGKYKEAFNLFWEMVTAEECPEFLTLPAYETLE